MKENRQEVKKEKNSGDKIHEAELAFDRKRRSIGFVCGPIYNGTMN